MQNDRLTKNMLTTKMKTSWNGTDVWKKGGIFKWNKCAKDFKKGKNKIILMT